MQTAIAAPGALQLFVPPYERLTVIARTPERLEELPRGAAVIWHLTHATCQQEEFDQLRDRPFGLPALVLLPPPDRIHYTLPLLNHVPAIRPRAVLPTASLISIEDLRRALATPPRNVADTIVQYLTERGVLSSRLITRHVHRILELAPHVTSITQLARRMYTSRRTLGRHFAVARVPVPSHWLQFARLLHLSFQIQNQSGAIFRLAVRAGYPDGFTMSNQMKRLIGCRPTDVRRCLGWEWIIEEWLRREMTKD